MLGDHAALRQLPLLTRTWWHAGRLVTLQQIDAAIQAVSQERIAGLLRRFPLLEPVVIADIGPLSAESLMGVPTVASIPAFLKEQRAAARAARAAESPPDSVMYLSTGEEVLALDGSTGAVRWRSPGSLRHLTRAQENLYGIDSDDILIALRAGWQHHLALASAGERVPRRRNAALRRDVRGRCLRRGPHRWRAPLAHRSTRVHADPHRPRWHSLRPSREPAGATLAALRLADGAPRWEHAWRYSRPLESHENERLPFALGDGLVYFSPFDDVLLALDAGSGEPVWRYTLSTDIEAAPLVRGEVVYVATNGRLFALRARDGAVLWRQRLSTEGIYSDSMYASELLLHVSSLVADDERAYLTEFYVQQYSHNADPGIATVFRAVSLADGAPAWERTRAVHFVLGSDDTLIRTAADWSPSEDATTVTAARDGAFLWDREVGQAMSVGAGRSTVYVVSGLNLQALRAEDGSMRWTYPLHARAASSPGALSPIVSLLAD